jgi:elongation factor G
VARNWREHLIDVLTEADTEDWITSAYLEGKPLAVEAMQKLVRRRTLANEIQPVFCGSGREHIGIQPLLDGICWYLPSPLDRPPVQGVHPKKRDKVEIRKPDPDEPFAALVFKIQADPHGELFYLRIYSGTVKANSRVLNPGKEAREFLTKLYHVHADPSNKEPVEIAYAGDIVAAIGPKVSITGDTLCDPQHPILLESIQFAETVVSMAIEPESSADKERLEQVLTILAREDPTFRWSVDRETGQTLMNGMGVLHLEIKLHRIREDFRLKVRVGKPRVSYRETIARPVRVWGECIRQTAAQSLFARLEVQFEHEHSREPVTFVNLVPPEILPPAWVSAIEQAIRGALQSGETGYPVIDVKVTLLSAQTHPTDSNELAFQVAAADAVSKALKNNVVLLEPVMRLEVTVPEQYLGPVTADLNARRAEIQQIHVRGNLRVIEAYVPLARMFDYADTVRSLTQGRASYTLEPYRYAPAPPEVLRQLLGLEGDGD